VVQKNSHKKAQEAQRKKYFAPNYFAKKFVYLVFRGSKKYNRLANQRLKHYRLVMVRKGCRKAPPFNCAHQQREQSQRSDHMNHFENTMPVSLRVQFRHMPQSRPIKQLVRHLAGRLGKFDLQGARCEVVIDEEHHGSKGGIYRVSVRLSMPGKRLYVASCEEESGSHAFLHSAVRTAFGEIERQLKKHRRRSYRRKVAELAA
jgi:ribosome-associated translation inhibitor RaiA